jgi:hypothetical protein
VFSNHPTDYFHKQVWGRINSAHCADPSRRSMNPGNADPRLFDSGVLRYYTYGRLYNMSTNIIAQAKYFTVSNLRPHSKSSSLQQESNASIRICILRTDSSASIGLRYLTFMHSLECDAGSYLGRLSLDISIARCGRVYFHATLQHGNNGSAAWHWEGNLSPECYCIDLSFAGTNGTRSPTQN